MTRRELLAVVGALFATAVVCVVAGLTWAFGPWGLIGGGLGLAAVVLAVLVLVDVREPSGDSVAAPARPNQRRKRGEPVQLQRMG